MTKPSGQVSNSEHNTTQTVSLHHLSLELNICCHQQKAKLILTYIIMAIQHGVSAERHGIIVYVTHLLLLNVKYFWCTPALTAGISKIWLGCLQEAVWSCCGLKYNKYVYLSRGKKERRDRAWRFWGRHPWQRSLKKLTSFLGVRHWLWRRAGCPHCLFQCAGRGSPTDDQTSDLWGNKILFGLWHSYRFAQVGMEMKMFYWFHWYVISSMQ